MRDALSASDAAKSVEPPNDPVPPSVARVFLFFLTTSCTTFGGGWSIISHMEKVLVQKRAWISAAELVDYISVGKSLPGTMVAHVSYMVGYRVKGWKGGIAAIIGLCTPPVVVMAFIATIYSRLLGVTMIHHALYGVRAAIVPIILSVIFSLGKSALLDWKSWVILAGALFMAAVLHVSMAVIAVAAALAGWLSYRKI